MEEGAADGGEGSGARVAELVVLRSVKLDVVGVEEGQNWVPVPEIGAESATEWWDEGLKSVPSSIRGQIDGEKDAYVGNCVLSATESSLRLFECLHANRSL